MSIFKYNMRKEPCFHTINGKHPLSLEYQITTKGNVFRNGGYTISTVIHLHTLNRRATQNYVIPTSTILELPIRGGGVI
jgi:hypothetical protein